jgi:hypothetical protein
MAGDDDLTSVTKGQVQNISRLAAWASAPGQTLSSTSSPRCTNLTSLTTTSILAIATSAVRRAIEFHSCDPTGNSNIWVMPGTTAFVRRGILIVPGARYQVPPQIAANNCFYAVASSGSTNSLSVVEFF